MPHIHIRAPVGLLDMLGPLKLHQGQQPHRFPVVRVLERLSHLAFNMHVLVSTCEQGVCHYSQWGPSQ